MKLIFLYGLPGVGKLTVANELGRRTGYGNFHAHLTVDLAKALFDQWSVPYVELINQIRECVIEKAAIEDLPGLLFTYAFGKGDEIWARRVVELVERNNGEVFFVHLHASREALMERVAREDRKRYRKLTDPDVMEEILKDYDFDLRIDHKHHISIDTTALNPSDVAGLIMEYFEL